jgi:hypothetical protein
MDRINDKFGRIGFNAIFDYDMKVAWSNEKRLFRKIASSNIFMEAYKTSAENREPFENLLTYNGVRFKAVFLPLTDRRYLCIAYPEDRFVRFAYSEMYMRIFNIRRSAEKIAAVSPDIYEVLKQFEASDDVMKLIEDQTRFAESVKYDADSISRIFDADRMCEYVSIRDKIKETFSHIKKYNTIISRYVTFDADIDCSVAKINYSLFEAALLEIVRIMYKYLPEGGSGSIIIRGNRDIGIRVEISAQRRDDFDVKDIDYEVRDIKCAFEYLGGSSVVSLGNDGLFVRATAPAALSNFNCRVKSYDLTDAPEDDAYEILSGYTGLTVDELKHTEGTVQFRSPVVEPEYPISEVLSDAVLRPLVEEMSLV